MTSNAVKQTPTIGLAIAITTFGVAGIAMASRAVEDRAMALLHAGSSLVLSLHIVSGFNLAAVAAVAGVPFAGVWLAAPAATMDLRLRARRHDASDASPAVLTQQLQQDPGTVDWVRIDAGTGSADCLSAARHALGLG